MKKNILKLFLFISLLFIFSPISVFAQEEKEAVTFTPQVTIPGSKFIANSSTTINGSLSTIGEYVKSIYNYLILLVGLVAVIASMIGGVIWLTAAGNTTRISTAKSWIGGSMTGLVLALSAYLILKTINPKLTDFRDTNIASIGEITTGCCRLPVDIDGSGNLVGTPGKRITRNSSAIECYSLGQELKQPEIQTIDKLKEQDQYKNLDENTLVKKYLENQGWYLSNYQSTIAGCDRIGMCYIDLDYATDKDSRKNFKYPCFRTTEENCRKFNNTVYFYMNDTFKSIAYSGEMGKIFDVKYTFDYRYQDCSAESAKKFIPSYETKSQLISNTELTTVWKNFISYYDGLWYTGRGNLGEPCGNDGGICVPSGKDCADIKYGNKNFQGREWAQGVFQDQLFGIGSSLGRWCDDNLKCCY